MLKKTSYFALFLISFIAFSQNQPFNCVYNAYLFQYNNIYALNLASGNSVLVAENVSDGKINAAAYNTVDGFLWGFLQEKPKTLLRIGNDFKTTEYNITSIPNEASTSYVGDVNIDGIYHYLKGKTVHKVDLNPDSENYLNYIGSFNLSKNISIHDWAFNVNDNHLYAVEKGTNHIYRINTTTNMLSDLGEVPVLQGNNYTYGAVYFDLDGNLYVSANQTGTVYIIRTTHAINSDEGIDSNLFAYGPASASNDGARCPSAPVPSENCANGVDDDGDGLVDCDDPSCSGISTCPTITLTTSAYNGGLESNNRLSQKITSRNYQRSKVNHEFNIAKAPVFKQKQRYLNQSKNDLRDFIPQNSIPNTETIITSPEDLIDLTNADAVFSIDYINPKKETVASILTLKTNNGVYEHTKYICDRLLGGEILSIGTLFIDEHPFIKTVIKNPGGEIEHVVSFSIRESKDFTYTIESHWNLDKYTKDESFFNFQIWSNNVDNLYTLSQNIIELFKNERNIKEFKISTPPKMYVRKGNYKNGKLNLNIINTYNNKTNTAIKGGIRATETSDTQQIQTYVDIENYNNTIELETGSLFDFGFRVEDEKGGTPDDLFVSDGPWGIDHSSALTTVIEYNISPNEQEFDENGYRLERNLKLVAETSNYISAYKAFNPRFRAVDIHNYDTLELNSKGTGQLTVVLMKESIKDWENQYKYTYELSKNLEIKQINIDDFVNNQSNKSIDTSDITMIVFLLKSKEGIVERKEMELKNIQFKNNHFLPQKDVLITDIDFNISNTILKNITNITYNSKDNGIYKLFIYNQMGTLVDFVSGKTNVGLNILEYNKPKIANGVYFYNLQINNNSNYKGKLIFVK